MHGLLRNDDVDPSSRGLPIRWASERSSSLPVGNRPLHIVSEFMHDSLIILVLLSLLASCVGTLAGMGGATLLVPALLLGGFEPATAAGLGLCCVAAGSLAAAPRQAADGLTHHRLSILTEIGASFGAAVGVLLAARISPTVLGLLLAAVAAAAGIAALISHGDADPEPSAVLALETPGEFPGTLSGQLQVPGGIAFYQAQRVGLSMTLLGLAGVVSGMSGVGGGFIKVPIFTSVMKIPYRVATATSTYSIGITASAGMILAAASGHTSASQSAPIIVGGILGGTTGSAISRRVNTEVIKRFGGVLLVVVAFAVVARQVWL